MPQSTKTPQRTWIVNVPTILTEERIADVLWGALDGNYGAARWWNNLYGFPLKASDEPSRLHLPTTFIVEGKKYTLDNDSIQRGLGILATKYTWHMNAILTESDDADTSDALLQCAVLGEIVYG